MIHSVSGQPIFVTDIFSKLNDTFYESFPSCIAITATQLVTKGYSEFYVLLAVHPGLILVNNAQIFMYVYLYSLHVSGSHLPM